MQDAEKLYRAAASTAMDALIDNWDATYAHFEKQDQKQIYYLSMEYLQGRALRNAVGNLELNGPMGEALKKV